MDERSRGSSTRMVWSGSYTPICRLCLQQDGFLLAIFNNHSSQTSITASEHRSIQKKIAECTALELSSGDGLPPCVCHRCLYKVELCLEFRRQCLVSDATLRRINGQSSNRNKDCNGEGGSDPDSEDYQASIQRNQFEQFAAQNEQAFLAEHGQNVEDVVMVVDPNMDYDSENDSEFEHHTSDNENASEHLKNVFMCKYCDKAYTVKEECRSHETTAHNNEIPFRCSSCDMGFADRTNFTAHQKSVHGNDKPFGCPQCERSFSRRSDLRKHTVVHTGIKPFTCNICFKSFSRNTNLTKHLRIHSGHKPYVCPQCPKTFISKGDLTRHAIIHSGQRPFACGYCDQSFGRRDKLIRHEKRHFPPQGTSTGDDAQLVLLRQQMEIGHGLWTEENSNAIKQELIEDERSQEIEEDCEDQESWSGENMIINVDPFGHHGHGYNANTEVTNNPSTDVKEESGTEDRSEHELLPRVPEHITADSSFCSTSALPTTAVQVKRYPCLVCHKKFPTADMLRYHMQLHSSGPKPHACHLCSKSFLRKRELDRHIATHTGMKPFKCSNCDKRFGRKDKLVRHMRIHETNRAHVCPLCGVSFARKDALTHHMKGHSTEEPPT